MCSKMNWCSILHTRPSLTGCGQHGRQEDQEEYTGKIHPPSAPQLSCCYSLYLQSQLWLEKNSEIHLIKRWMDLIVSLAPVL